MNNCPLCKIPLDQALLSNVGVDYCSRCYGLWFEEDELQEAKDQKDENLRWLDIDLWKDETKFRIERGQKICPTDRLPLYEVRYGDSSVKLDVCNICHGIWLDRGEFKSIIVYLQKKADYEILHHAMKNVAEEIWEIFSGPEMLREELLDFLMVMKLVSYKFAAQHPRIADLVRSIPR